MLVDATIPSVQPLPFPSLSLVPFSGAFPSSPLSPFGEQSWRANRPLTPHSLTSFAHPPTLACTFPLFPSPPLPPPPLPCPWARLRPRRPPWLRPCSPSSSPSCSSPPTPPSPSPRSPTALTFSSSATRPRASGGRAPTSTSPCVLLLPARPGPSFSSSPSFHLPALSERGDIMV